MTRIKKCLNYKHIVFFRSDRFTKSVQEYISQNEFFLSAPYNVELKKSLKVFLYATLKYM